MINEFTENSWIELNTFSKIFDSIFINDDREKSLQYFLKQYYNEDNDFLRKLIVEIFDFTFDPKLRALSDSEFFSLLKSLTNEEKLKKNKKFYYNRFPNISKHKITSFYELHELILDITILENRYGFTLDRNNDVIFSLIMFVEMKKKI